jgi:hypothetical protein
VIHPNHGDVVMREGYRDSIAIFLLGTHETPDQFIVRTRDDAVSRGVAYAKRQGVRAWFAQAGGNFVLFATFRDEDPDCVEQSVGR